MEGAKVSQEILPQAFDNPEFGTIRVVKNESGEPLFLVKDICDFFGVTNRNRVLQQLDNDEKGGTQIDTPGGKQTMTYLTEAGLYHFLFVIQPSKARGIPQEEVDAKCRLVNRYKRWVTHDVLPAIRRDGGYMVARDGETPQETMARALLIAQETINRKDSTIAAQRDTIRELSPKAAFFDAVGDSDGKMSVADLSKALRQAGIGMGQNRLFKWFRDNGYMGKRGIHRNRPTQRAIEQGLFYLHDTTFVRRDGKVFNSFTPMVTAKGATVFFKAISKQLQMSIEL